MVLSIRSADGARPVGWLAVDIIGRASVIGLTDRGAHGDDGGQGLVSCVRGGPGPRRHRPSEAATGDEAYGRPYDRDENAKEKQHSKGRTDADGGQPDALFNHGLIDALPPRSGVGQRLWRLYTKDLSHNN